MLEWMQNGVGRFFRRLRTTRFGGLMKRPGLPRTVIFSGVRWNFTWQRHHSLAAAAAANGPVLFVEPMPRRALQVLSYLRKVIRKDSTVRIAQPVPAGVEVISFAGYLAWCVRLLPSRWLRRRRRPRPEDVDIALCYVPSLMLLPLLLMLSPRSIVYDNVVDWRNAPADWYPPRYHRWVERRLASSSKHPAAVITDSALIRQRWERAGFACTTVLPAADEAFLAGNWRQTAASRTIGYFGAVRPTEISVDILLRYAVSGWDVRAVGPADATIVETMTQGGISFHPAVSNGELVRLMQDWGAVILPYSESPRLATLVPAKLFNAIATQRPVHVFGLTLPEEVLEVCSSEKIEGGLVIRSTSDRIPTWEDRWKQVLAATSQRS